MTTILQLTDTHLYADIEGRMKGVNTYQSLNDVVELAGSRETVDLVVLSGDLSQDETLDSYKHVAELVSKLSLPVVYMPGNHDDHALMKEALEPSGFNQPGSSELDSWTIVYLDSTEPGFVEGWLSKAELERLDRELAAVGERHALIFLHHNPINLSSEREDRMMLKNADQLFSITDRYSCVKAIVFGHVHQEYMELRKGVRLLASPSTCVQFRPTNTGIAIDDKPPGYRILRLAADGGIETDVRRLPALPDGLMLSGEDL